MEWTSGWTAVGSIATCIVAVGVIYAFLQLRQARKSTDAQIAMGLYGELRNEETLKKIRGIYNLSKNELKDLPDKKNDSLNKKREDIDYVLDRLDTLAVFLYKGVVDKKIAIESYGGTTALRCWYCLSSYIRIMRDDRGYYADYFEYFVKECLNDFDKAKIRVMFSNTSDPTKIDLVTELQKPELRPRTLNEIKKARNTILNQAETSPSTDIFEPE